MRFGKTFVASLLNADGKDDEKIPILKPASTSSQDTMINYGNQQWQNPTFENGVRNTSAGGF